MKTDEKITLWSERIHEFQFSGQTCKTWCQEHHVPVSSMNYWMRKLKKLDEQSDTDMIFAKMPTEKEISKNETLNISPSPVRIFITNAIRIGFTHSLWSVYFWHTCFCLLSQNVKQGRSNISIRSAPILPFSTNTILSQLSLLLCKFNNNTKSLRIFSTTIVLFLHAVLQ